MLLDPDVCYRALATRDARFDGRLFVGVRTTGIYCRPICPARTPLRANVRFFVSAAAAQEAGFRPCLRCRPESSPDLGAWRGASNTVSRALALIGDGTLDAEAVEHLADRLGVGERHLRRLFKQHLGASPIAVAQTRRVLFARRLIAETAMPMSEVALASGFGSVRRFNSTFAALYQRPPRDLRRQHAPEASGAAGVTLRLAYVEPYDWTALLAFLSARAIPGVERIGDGRYSRTIALDGRYGVVDIRQDPDGPALLASIRFPLVQRLSTIVERLRRLFDLGADPAAINGRLSADPALASLVAARPGLRVPGAWDGFELAVRGVLGQQITVAAATRLAGKLAAVYGRPLETPDPSGLTHLFPAPERLAGADLGVLGMPGARARARALSALAEAAAADPRLFAPGQDLDQAMARLRALPGVGDWTAQYVAMRALRDPDAFPAADIGLMRARAGPDGLRPSAAALLAQAEAWRPWRAYAALHLWAADGAAKPPASAPAAPLEHSHAHA